LTSSVPVHIFSGGRKENYVRPVRGKQGQLRGGGLYRGKGKNANTPLFWKKGGGKGNHGCKGKGGNVEKITPPGRKKNESKHL